MLEHKIMSSLAFVDVLPANAFWRMLSSVWDRGAEMKKPAGDRRDNVSAAGVHVLGR